MKKLIMIISLIVLYLILLVPIPTSLNDGGTVIWSALTYKIVKWHAITEVTSNGPVYYRKTSFYWFPDNFKSIDELGEMEMHDS